MPSASPPARPVTAADVDAAAARIATAVAATPLQPSRRLSQQTGLDVWLKREDQQAGRSYKSRGAYNLIAQLSPSEVEAGVVAASAGNHAQGVAHACASRGVHATIFLPSTTPRQKRDRVAEIGGAWVEIVIAGNFFDEAATAAHIDANTRGATLVPPFDDARIIAGQGTAIREAVGQLGRSPDAVLVPVGGGGLLAGTVAWLRERHPATRIIGVEPQGAPSLARALEAGEPVTLPEVDTFVDGASVARVGDVTFAVLRDQVDSVVEVPEGLICLEMVDLYQQEGIIAEPAGALASAALRLPGGFGVELAPDAAVICLLSGGNNDLSRYAEISERAVVYEGRKHYFLVEFPQEPGALRRFLDEVLGPGDDITLFEYVKRSNRDSGPALVGIEMAHADDLVALLERMEESPLRVTQLPPDSPITRFLV